jgi:hypothetical protein
MPPVDIHHGRNIRRLVVAGFGMDTAGEETQPHHQDS